jgi:hypothetical protein
MVARYGLVCALVGASTLASATVHADGLIIERITRHGYVMVDDPGASAPYDGFVPVGSTASILSFTADVTQTLDAAGEPHGDFIAVMQLDVERRTLAFYLGIRNDTRGIGIRNPSDPRSEVYDLNRSAGTAYPVTGFVYLNSMTYYSGPFNEFGRYLICTQEFGHRYSAHLRVPPVPAGPAVDPDAGVPDGGAPDAGPPDAAVQTPIDPNSLLGRQTAHWSYFVNTGASPMEGNAWEEISPGVFRTGRPTFHFSSLDMYVMGLIPASAVQPFWLIAEPNVMGQSDSNGRPITAESPPEYAGWSPQSEGRAVTIRGRRVTYTMDDLIRANGPRVPAYQDPADGGAPDGGARDGGSVGADPNLRVTWVLLATPGRVGPRTADEFDYAIESCTSGYNGASDERSRLVAISTPLPDAGVPDDVPTNVGDGNADAGANADALGGREFTAGGGCACDTAGAARRVSRAQRAGGLAGLLLVALGLRRARRRKTLRSGTLPA